MPSLKNLLEELKVRRVRNTMAIYVSSALTSVGAVKLFTEAYDLPQVLFPIGVTILTCGLASAFAFAWYHGKEGGQKFQKKEIAIHSLVLIVALVGSLRVGGAAKPASLWADAQSIAVLPFKNMSDSKEDEFFSDGITEDILTQLCKIGDLRVISRTSIMKYKDTEKTIPEIAQELGVGTVLEGSVRRSGNRMRITGQLIKARTDEHVWAETDDREMKDIFATQMDVAQRIAESLRATLSPDERRRIEKPATMNIEAYALYLKGREYYNRYTVEDNERAIELFKKAIALD